MKIYEKPSVNIRMFDVEDIMTASAVTGAEYDVFSTDTAAFQEITGEAGTTYAGVAFEW